MQHTKGRNDEYSVNLYWENAKKLTEIYIEQEVFWRQRCKQLWLPEGDCNSKFFHAATKARRKMNKIDVLKDDTGMEVGWGTGLEETMIRYFSDLFTATNTEVSSLINTVLCRKTMSKKPKSERCSWSAELFGSNEDLLRKIFLLLPVPPLVRFKSVSKLWLSLISEPHFGRNHFLGHRDPSSVMPSGLFFSRCPLNSHVFALLSLKSTAKIPGQYSILQDGFGLVKMVQSCSGLQLVRVFTPDNQSKLYFVGNWTTRQVKMIPLPELSDLSRSYFFCNLAFDPLRSPHYKIVCAKRVNLDQSQFDIYSSETGEWKTTNVTADDPMQIDFENGVYWNGAILWIKNDGVRLTIYHFEVEGEKLMKVRMRSHPPQVDDLYLRYFGECNGHLHVVFVRDLMSKHIYISEMDKATMKLFLKYKVHVDQLLSSFPEVFVVKHQLYDKSCYALTILYVVRGEKEEADALVMLIPGKVISYNLKSKKFEVLAYLTCQDVDVVQFRYVPCHQFVPTLYPLSA